MPLPANLRDYWDTLTSDQIAGGSKALDETQSLLRDLTKARFDMKALIEPYVGGGNVPVVMYNPGPVLPEQRLSPPGELVNSVAASSYSDVARNWRFPDITLAAWRGKRDWARRIVGANDIVGMDLVPWHSHNFVGPLPTSPESLDWMFERVLEPAAHLAAAARCPLLCIGALTRNLFTGAPWQKRFGKTTVVHKVGPGMQVSHGNVVPPGWYFWRLSVARLGDVFGTHLAQIGMQVPGPELDQLQSVLLR